MASFAPLKIHNSYAELPQSLYSKVNGQPLQAPEWVHVNTALAQQLNIPQETLNHPEFLKVMSAETDLPGGISLAMKYYGHQFGGFNPDLGDGRGLLLGELQDDHNQLWDLHLKGAGQTPYSRGADGRAVLRSSIREYLCSAAMTGLGIASSQALCIVRSDDLVYREQAEPAAMVCRVARSHVRFGHFEYLYYSKQHDVLRTLADYVIRRNFVESGVSEGDYNAWFHEIVRRNAQLVAQWQSAGFAHGVMNTDNMSIIGDTFDYGPFAFIDDFDPSFICNHSDHSGRYAFNKQPSITFWNLQALAQALQPLLSPEQLQTALAEFEPLFQSFYRTLLREKLGLYQELEGDVELMNATLNMLSSNALDYTSFMRDLATITCDNNVDIWRNQCKDLSSFDDWFLNYRQRIRIENKDQQQRLNDMLACNPRFVLRNYLAQNAIERANDHDYQGIEDLITVLAKPFDDHPLLADLALTPPQWGKELSISCSS